DSTHVWAVGNSGTIDFYNGTSWATQTSNTTLKLEDVYALDSSHVWAVGSTGTIDFYNGTSWATQTSPVSNNLTGVWLVDANNGWIAGDGGKILKTTDGGTNWSTVSSPAGATNLKGVTFVDSTHGWISGDNSTILFYNGSSWSAQTAQASAKNCLAIAASSTSRVIFGCDTGHMEITSTGGTTRMSPRAQKGGVALSPPPDPGAFGRLRPGHDPEQAMGP